MARTTKNVLGSQRGQIGEVVGKVVDGVQIYSAHTDAIKNPRTPKQVSYRSRFAAITQLGRSLYGATKIGLRSEASRHKLNSPFNIFVKTNMPTASYDPDTRLASIDYEHVVVSTGITPYVGFSGFSFSEPLKVTATFAPYSDSPGANADDRVYLVAYLPELGFSNISFGQRSVGTVTSTLPAVCGGKVAYLWGFTRTSITDPVYVAEFGQNLQPGECSTSFYLGTGNILAQ